MTPIARGHFEDMTHILNSVRAPSLENFQWFGNSFYKRPLQPPIAVSCICVFLHYALKIISTFVYALGYAHRRFAFPDPTSALTAEVYDT